jgi:hypothetical protein
VLGARQQGQPGAQQRRGGVQGVLDSLGGRQPRRQTAPASGNQPAGTPNGGTQQPAAGQQQKKPDWRDVLQDALKKKQQEQQQQQPPEQQEQPK